MIFFPIFIGQQYVKKEDASQALRNQRLYGFFTGIALFISVLILQLILAPKIEALYSDFSVVRSPLNQVAPYFAFVTALLYLVYTAFELFAKHDDSDFQTKLTRYKEGEMIKIGELLGDRMKRQAWLILAGGALIGLTVATYLLPIYQLTSSSR